MFIDLRNTNLLLDKLSYCIEQNDSLIALLIDFDNFHDSSPITNDDKINLAYNFLNENLSPEVHYLGKDEFFCIITDISIEQIISELYLCKKQLPQKNVSSFCAGIAEYPKNGKDEMEIVRLLEEAIYQGKKTGKNQITFAHDTKMKLKNNYYTTTQLERLTELSKISKRNESSLLREALDLLLRTYLD